MTTCCSMPGCQCADPDCFCSDCKRTIREQRRQRRRERNLSMNEEVMYRILMFSGMALAILAGCGALTLLVLTALEPTGGGVFGTIAMAGATVAFGWGGVHFGQRSSGHQRVFSNAAEREVLNVKQRRELRIARGSVVMQKALLDVEEERDKLVTRELEGPQEEAVKPEPISDPKPWQQDRRY